MSPTDLCANCGHERRLHGAIQEKGSNWCIARASGQRAAPFSICNCTAFVAPSSAPETAPTKWTNVDAQEETVSVLWEFARAAPTVKCEWARSDTTPCVVKDGSLALSDDNHCVGCNRLFALTVVPPPRPEISGPQTPDAATLQATLRYEAAHLEVTLKAQGSEPTWDFTAAEMARRQSVITEFRWLADALPSLLAAKQRVLRMEKICTEAMEDVDIAMEVVDIADARNSLLEQELSAARSRIATLENETTETRRGGG